MTTAEPWQVEATKHFDTCFYQVLAKPPNCSIKLRALSRSSEGRRGWPEMQEGIETAVGFKRSSVSIVVPLHCKRITFCLL